MREKFGFRGETSVLEAAFKAIDGDDTGKVGFDEISAWLNDKKTLSFTGRQIVRSMTENFHVAAAASQADDMSLAHALANVFEGESQRAHASNQPRPGAAHAPDKPAVWDAERMRQLFLYAVRESRARIIDVLQTWDQTGDDVLSRKEWLRSTKELVIGTDPPPAKENLWYAHVREATIAAFAKIDRSGDGFINIGELCRWLDPDGTLLGAKAASATLRPSDAPVEAAVQGQAAGAAAARLPEPSHVLKRLPTTMLGLPPSSPRISPLLSRQARSPPKRPPPAPAPLYCSRYAPWLELLLRERQVSSASPHLENALRVASLALPNSTPTSPRKPNLASPRWPGPSSPRRSPYQGSTSPRWRDSPSLGKGKQPSSTAPHLPPAPQQATTKASHSPSLRAHTRLTTLA